MNIVKNMEAIFVAAAVLGAATGYATASEPVIKVAATRAAATVDAKMPVVVVSAKRLTAAEKAAL